MRSSNSEYFPDEPRALFDLPLFFVGEESETNSSVARTLKPSATILETIRSISFGSVSERSARAWPALMTPAVNFF